MTLPPTESNYNTATAPSAPSDACPSSAGKSEGKASQNKRKKRDSLLANAFELFTQKGITDTTISDIVERAGVAKGTFYLYFKDKYDLRDLLIRSKAEQILSKSYQAIEAARQENPGTLDTLEEQVLFFADNILSQLTQDRILLRFISKNLSWALLKHDITTLETPGTEGTLTVGDQLKRYFYESAVQYQNPEVLLYMITEFVSSTCYSSILDSVPLPIEELKPFILSSVRAIMRSQEITDTASTCSNVSLS